MQENQRTYKSIMDMTVNSSVYKKARKKFLEHNGKLKCSICKYHLGENEDSKYYGTVRPWYLGTKIRYPNWKLATKNKKQWYDKPKSYKVIKKSDYDKKDYSYTDIKF